MMSAIELLQKPVVFNGTPSTILDETRNLIDKRKKLWDSLAEDVALENVTFENFIIPILQNENDETARRQILLFYGSISPVKDVREASNQASKMFANADVDMYLRNDIFQLTKALIQRQERNE